MQPKLLRILVFLGAALTVYFLLFYQDKIAQHSAMPQRKINSWIMSSHVQAIV